MPFNISKFYEMFKKSNGISPRFQNNTNRIKFLLTEEDASTSVVSTDMIKAIDVYVRVIMNVQLLSNSDIAYIETAALADNAKYFDKANDITLGDPEGYGYKFIKHTGKSQVRNVEIINWLNIDVPYIKSNIEMVNSSLSVITKAYNEICAKNNISGEEYCINAKFIAIINPVYNPDTYSNYMVANYQKPNMNVSNILVRTHVPTNIEINTIFDKMELHYGCEFVVCNGPAGITHDEVVFNEKLLISEMNVVQFVKKTENVTLPQYNSRDIILSKKESKFPLIKNYKGNISVGILVCSFHENPKIIGIVEDFIKGFFEKNSIVSPKFAKPVINAVGIAFTNKVMKKFY